MLKNKKYLRLISRRFWGSVFSFVIAIAVLVQLGREAFPLLNDYKYEIENLLSQTFNLDVEVRQFAAHWSGLRPRVEMTDVNIVGSNGSPIIQFSQSVAELGIIDSIMQRRLYWRELSFQDIRITLLQTQDGNWQLEGYPNQDSNRDSDTQRYSIRDPLDVLLIGRRVKLIDTHINITFANGEIDEVLVPEVSIENDDDFLRVIANAAIDENTNSFEFVLEGHGNPRNPEAFKPNGYLAFNNFPALDVYTLFANQAGFDDVMALSSEQGLNLELWFRGLPVNGMKFRGEVQLGDARLEVAEKQLAIEDTYLQYNGSWKLADGWSLDFQNFRSTLNKANISNINASLTKLVDQPLRLNLVELNAEQANKFILAADLTGDIKNRESIGYILHNLNPRGKILNLEAELRNASQGYFFATANVADGLADPVLGSPGVSNLNAYVEFSALNGRANIVSDNGLNLFFPEIYPEPFKVQEAYGQVNWEVDIKKRVAYLTTNTVKVKVEDEEANGAVSLTLPFARKYGEQLMTLIIGVESFRAKNLKQFIPTTISPQLYEWLKDSINDGRVTDGEFVYHGSISKGPEVAPSIQLFANMFDGNVVFDPQWPELKEIDATLLLDNDQLNVSVRNASILGNTVESSKISLTKTADDKPALLIQGKLSSETASAIKLLKSSPIGEVIGNAFDTWHVSGDVATSVESVIPLTEDATQAYHKVEASFSDAGVNITDAEIEINAIKGKLDFHTETGFSSRDLTGQIWGRDFSFDVNTVSRGDTIEDTEIAFDGSTGVDDLVNWIKMPVLLYLEGETNIRGRVVISGEEDPKWPVDIFYYSNLAGVEFNLPAPLDKASEGLQNLAGVVHVGEESSLYQMQLEDVLDFYFMDHAEKDDLALASIGSTISENDLTKTRPGYFTVSGTVDYYNLDEWIIVGEKFEEYEKLIASEAEQEELSFVIDVQVKNLDLDYINVPDAKVNALVIGDHWDIDIDSELMKGNVILPGLNTPIFDFEYIRLDEIATDQLFGDPDRAATEVSAEPVSIKDLDPFDFSTGEFVLHDKALGFNDLGGWHFRLRVEENRAVFSDIFADSIGLSLKGEQEDGAIMIWNEIDGESHTTFSAKINTENVADVLAAMNLDRVVTSKSAKVDLDMQWEGTPVDVALENLLGNLSFDMKSGSFIRGAEGDETELLRLLALFNFDTIARRLKLDFSDLASEGFFYDQVKGNLNFEDGKILMSSPIEVSASTSTMRMAGIIDLVEEELDTELVVTLPVAGNLATLVGFLGGLPAGVGIYIVSKIFKKQVDKLSSLSYEVTGKWEDPKIKIKRVFDDRGADRKAGELKEKTTSKTESRSELTN